MGKLVERVSGKSRLGDYFEEEMYGGKLVGEEAA